MISIILYYNIKILWDHRRVCGPSLTKTSLCGACSYNSKYTSNVQQCDVLTPVSTLGKSALRHGINLPVPYHILCRQTSKYKCFGGTYYIHHQGRRKTPYVCQKRLYPCTKIHGVAFQKATVVTVTVVITSNITWPIRVCHFSVASKRDGCWEVTPQQERLCRIRAGWWHQHDSLDTT